MPSPISSRSFLNQLTTALHHFKNDSPFDLSLLDKQQRIYLIGNGGSAAIAAHIANDLVKAGWSAFSLTDGPTLTCLANDFGYERCYEQQLMSHMRVNDCLIAISSSGKSQNIINAVSRVSEIASAVVTLTGFDPDNTLRQWGDHNYYVPSQNYGVVETAHLAILHSIVKPD